MVKDEGGKDGQVEVCVWVFLEQNKVHNLFLKVVRKRLTVSFFVCLLSSLAPLQMAFFTVAVQVAMAVLISAASILKSGESMMLSNAVSWKLSQAE